MTELHNEGADFNEKDISNLGEYTKLVETVNEVKEALFGEIDRLIAESEVDAAKFYEKGVKSAGSRLRKNCQSIKKLIHGPTIRGEFNKIKDQAQALREDTANK